MVAPILWNDSMKGAIWEWELGRGKRPSVLCGYPAQIPVFPQMSQLRAPNMMESVKDPITWCGTLPRQPAVLLDLQWHEPREKNLGRLAKQSPYPIWSLRFFHENSLSLALARRLPFRFKDLGKHIWDDVWHKLQAASFEPDMVSCLAKRPIHPESGPLVSVPRICYEDVEKWRNPEMLHHNVFCGGTASNLWWDALLDDYSSLKIMSWCQPLISHQDS